MDDVTEESALRDPVDALLFDYLSTDGTAGSDRLATLRRDHPEHAAELEKRLACLDRIGFLVDPDTDEPELQRIGGYRLLRRLGSGAMGTVYLAEQESLRRPVAVKLIHPHLARSPRSVERFRREAMAASRLEHPGICPVLDVGEERGVHYLAMRYVEGRALRDCIAQAGEAGRSLVDLPPGVSTNDPTPVLAFVESLARALDAAHTAGLVHRDVKPGNVIVTPGGHPVLVDFGLARLEDEASDLTRSDDRLGTPLYMAPEQVRGAGAVADVRTDVYALGVVLYECLALRPPFEATNRDSLYRQILGSEPPAPRLGGRRLPRDLRVVLRTALAKDPGRRYRSAAALANDLEAVRLHRPIAARPPGPIERSFHFVQQNPLAAALLGVLVSALIGALILLEARDRALGRAEVLELARRARDLGDESPAAGLRLALQAFDREPSLVTRSELYAAVALSRERALLMHERGPMGALWGATFTADSRSVLSWSDDGTARLWSHRDGSSIVFPHRGPVHWAAVAADDRIVTVSFDGTAAIWRSDGTRIAELEHGPMPDDDRYYLRAVLEPGYAHLVYGGALSPDGRRLLTTCSDRILRVWNLDSGALEHEFAGQPGFVRHAAAWSPDGRTVAVATDYAELRPPEPPQFGLVLLEADSGEVVRRLPHDDSVHWLAFSPDGARLLTACRDGHVRVFDVSGDRDPLLLEHRGPVWRARWSEDGRRILTASDDHTARLWRADDGASLQVFHHVGPVYEARFAPDEQTVWTASWESARRFDLDGRELLRLVGHGDRVLDVQVSPDGRQVVTASWDQTARVWDVIDSELPTLTGHRAAIRGLALAPDASVVSVAVDGEARCWELTSLSSRPIPIGPGAQGVEVSPDGERLLVAYADSHARVHRLTDGVVTASIRDRGHVGIAACWAEDRRIYSSGREGDVLEWSLSDEAPAPRSLAKANSRVYALDVAPSTARRHPLLAWGTWNGDMTVYESARNSSSWQAHEHWVTCVAFDPSALRVASGCADGSMRIWGVDGAPHPESSQRHGGALCCLAWSNDGEWLATGSADRTARLWRASDGEPWAVLRGHRGPVRSVLFLPDGRLLTGGDDGTIRTWAAPGELRGCAERRLSRSDGR